MSGSGFGKIFRITTWGESHGPALGVVIDGCPAGLPLSEADIVPYLERRRTGNIPGTSPRKEADAPRILSGVYEGVTLGTPISIMIENTNARSSDYDELKNIYRPAHADEFYDIKYGVRDYRGGGRSSGRETAARVMAGAVAAKLLNHYGITVSSEVVSIGQADNKEDFMKEVEKAQQNGDSVGGVVVCRAQGVPAGLGEPVFDKLDAVLAQAVMSIGAVKSVEFGCGTAAGFMTGTEYTSCNYKDEKNNAGGITGGMSNGNEIVLRASIKPTPSISVPQLMKTADGSETEYAIKGRHDACIALRAGVVMESMVAITLADMYLQNKLSKL